MTLAYYFWYYITHPRDFLALITFWLSGGTNLHKSIPKNLDKDWFWCYDKLITTSRSFSGLCFRMHPEAQNPLCLFYVILRALDTIEDDMKPGVREKQHHLINFYKHLEEPGWKLRGFGDKKDEILLLENFDKVIKCFLTLKPEYREIIKETCRIMGSGMAEFLERPIISLEDWDLYAHYVAGIVGHGMSRFYLVAGLCHFPTLPEANGKISENTSIPSAELMRLANNGGVFLQKVNMIRDIVEDASEVPPRIFWPRDVWSKYVNEIQDLLLTKDPRYVTNETAEFNRKNSLACLNELVTNAIGHVPACLDYLKHFKSLIPGDTSIFSFAGIGTLMSMSTLELCYNNESVLQRNVKIPKGEALRIMNTATNYAAVLESVIEYSSKLMAKADLIGRQNTKDMNSRRMHSLLKDIISRCQDDLLEINRKKS